MSNVLFRTTGAVWQFGTQEIAQRVASERGYYWGLCVFNGNFYVAELLTDLQGLGCVDIRKETP